MKIFKGDHDCGTITEVEVKKVTPLYVYFLNGQKEKIDESYYCYKHSRAEVKLCMIEIARERIRITEQILEADRKCRQDIPFSLSELFLLMQQKNEKILVLQKRKLELIKAL